MKTTKAVFIGLGYLNKDAELSFKEAKKITKDFTLIGRQRNDGHGQSYNFVYTENTVYIYFN